LSSGVRLCGGLCATAIAVLVMLAAASAAGATAHSFTYTRDGVSHFRTTAQNAIYQANECSTNGLERCGDFITAGDGDAFASDCRASGRSTDDVSRSLRYWARRALARGADWRVYTWTASGGYPHSCRFGLVRLPDG
jgi:hypothetical protein